MGQPWTVKYVHPELIYETRQDYISQEVGPEFVAELAAQLLEDNAVFADVVGKKVEIEGLDWLNRWMKTEGLKIEEVQG